MRRRSRQDGSSVAIEAQTQPHFPDHRVFYSEASWAKLLAELSARIWLDPSRFTPSLIGLVDGAGTRFVISIHFAAIFNELADQVLLAAVFVGGDLDNVRLGNANPLP